MLNNIERSLSVMFVFAKSKIVLRDMTQLIKKKLRS